MVYAPTFAHVDELIENDEDYAVEFKSTARWDLREGNAQQGDGRRRRQDGRGFLNTDGGTLLIGVGPDRVSCRLAHDYPHVKPTNGDGFVNWLTTHLINALAPPR